jgi:hypothetical protein
VKPECACSTYESARSADTFTCGGNISAVDGVKKELAEPYADTT